MSIVNQYNEDGIFIQTWKRIYWFNSKRLEYWCKMPHDEFNTFRIFTYNTELYLNRNCDENCNCLESEQHLFCFKNGKFIKWKIMTKELFWFFISDMHVYTDDFVYFFNYKFRKFKSSNKLPLKKFIKNGYCMDSSKIFHERTTLPQKPYWNSNHSMIFLDGKIYVFGEQNEKYDLISKTWTRFKNSDLDYYTTYYHKGIIYAFSQMEDIAYQIYNPKQDTWTEVIYEWLELAFGKKLFTSVA